MILTLVIFGSLVMLVDRLSDRGLEVGHIGIVMSSIADDSSQDDGLVYILHSDYSGVNYFWTVTCQPFATHRTPFRNPTAYDYPPAFPSDSPLAALEDPSLYVKVHRLDDVQPFAHYGQTIRCHYTPVDPKTPLPPVYRTLVSMGIITFELDRRLFWTTEYFDEFAMRPQVINNVTHDYTAWNQQPGEHVVVCQLPD